MEWFIVGLSFGVSFGVWFMNSVWIRRIRSWREDVLKGKIPEAEKAIDRLSFQAKNGAKLLQPLITDQVEHLRGLRGQVKGFENLLRHYAGEDFEPEAGAMKVAEVFDPHQNERPIDFPSEVSYGPRAAVQKPIAVQSPGECFTSRGNVSSIIDFDAIRKHPEGCTCDTCWPDDPVLYSDEALDEAVKNGAVLVVGKDEKK